MENLFVKNLGKRNTRTENWAVSNSTSGSSLVDYFFRCSSNRNRTMDEISADLSACWAEDQNLTLRLIFYNRMITRDIIMGEKNGEKIKLGFHAGQGNKDESIKSLIWLKEFHPDVFYRNMKYIPLVGTWKDLWYISSITKSAILYPEKKALFNLIASGMTDNFQRQLIAKYLPKPRSRKNRKNKKHELESRFISEFCKFMRWSERDYRRFKSNPDNKQHQFQRLMSARKWDELDFNLFPSKALRLVSTSTGKDGLTTIERHNLENDLLSWMDKKGEISFVGYPHELLLAMKRGKLNLLKKSLLDKQFSYSVKNAPDLPGNIMCALDTSSSMSWDYFPGNVTPYDICISLGVFFSEKNTGWFKDIVIMFNDRSRYLKLKGSFTDKILQIQKTSTAWGGTNFQSVIDEIVRIRKQNPNIPISDFPDTLLVVSDMQFNPTGTEETNYENAMRKLANVGLPKIRVIWWNVTSRNNVFTGEKISDVPSTLDDKGTILINGFDPNILNLLLNREVKEGKKGTEIDPWEAFISAMDQPILNLLS